MQRGASNPDLRMALLEVTAPSNPPMSRDEAKDHLHVLNDDDNDYIDSLIEVVRKKIDGADGYLGRCLITQTWDCFLDWNFPDGDRSIEIPLGPLQSVTYIKHTDTDGVVQTVNSSVYTVDIKTARSRILPAYSQYWPSCRDIVNAVQIRGVFGHGLTDASIPAPIKHAMKLMIGHLYENREETTTLDLSALPQGVAALLEPYRLRRF